LSAILKISLQADLKITEDAARDPCGADEGKCFFRRKFVDFDQAYAWCCAGASYPTLADGAADLFYEAHREVRGSNAIEFIAPNSS
jgi:hypothetical protein